MMTIYRDTSGKIRREIVEALELINTVCDRLGAPFFVVGAGARDIFFGALYDIPTRRATFDVDIGIRAKSWKEAEQIVTALTETGRLTVSTRLQFRLKHTNGVLVDVIPFGELERPAGKIQWPNDDMVMTTTGFKEAFESSIVVRVKNDPPLDVRICTPPSMVVLKLIAWKEKYPERADDALDIKFILEHYVDAGNDGRLHDEDDDLHEEDDFDYGRAGARMIGRDITKVVSPETMVDVLEILDQETNSKSDFRLIGDMNRGNSTDDAFEETLKLLQQLMRGIVEKPRMKKHGKN